MKKALSIILSVLVVFSMLGMCAAAEEETGNEAATDLVTVTFIVDGKVYGVVNTKPGLIFVDRVSKGGDAELGVPAKAPADGKEFIFKHWEVAKNVTVDENGNYTYEPTGITTFTANIPAAEEDVYYFAVFAEEDVVENQSFWAFVKSIFERINMIFEYFAKVFEGVIDF